MSEKTRSTTRALEYQSAMEEAKKARDEAILPSLERRSAMAKSMTLKLLRPNYLKEYDGVLSALYGYSLSSQYGSDLGIQGNDPWETQGWMFLRGKIEVLQVTDQGVFFHLHDLMSRYQLKSLNNVPQRCFLSLEKLSMGDRDMAKEMRQIIYGWQANQLEEEMRTAANLHRRLAKSEGKINEMQSGARLRRELDNAEYLRGRIQGLTLDPNAERRLEKLRNLSQA